MTAPALMPIFQSAKGETLLLLVRNTPTLLKSMPRPYVTSMMVPLLVQAADQGKLISLLPTFCMGWHQLLSSSAWDAATAVPAVPAAAAAAAAAG